MERGGAEGKAIKTYKVKCLYRSRAEMENVTNQKVIKDGKYSKGDLQQEAEELCLKGRVRLIVTSLSFPHLQPFQLAVVCRSSLLWLFLQSALSPSSAFLPSPSLPPSFLPGSGPARPEANTTHSVNITP